MMANEVKVNFANLKLSQLSKDDKIKYVGPKILEALENGGIETVGALANATVEAIITILEGADVSKIAWDRERIEEMIQIAQNKILAQKKNVAQSETGSAGGQPATVSGERVENPEWRTYEEFTVFFNYGDSEDGQKLWRALIHPQDDVDKPEPPKWHPDPNDEGYTVQFEFQSGENGQKLWRTLIYNGETLEETNVTGWTPDQWWPWIAEKASLTEEALQAAIQDDEGIESMTLPKAVKRQVMEASEDALALKVNGFKHRSSEKRANKLAADVNFSIAGEQADELLAQWPPLQFQVEVFVVNLENKVSSLVGFVSQNAEPGKVEYTSEIEFSMPELGHYKPHCLVRMLPSGEAAYLEGPSFEVVPKKLGS